MSNDNDSDVDVHNDGEAGYDDPICGLGTELARRLQAEKKTTNAMLL